MAIKEGDFVTIDYTGEVDGKVFDTTDENIAKENGLYEENKKFGPVTIVVGAHLIKGLDESLIGREEGEEYEVDIPPEKGFGKKNPSLVKIVPSNIFKEQKMNIVPGMLVSFDGVVGKIVSSSSGRVIVDFNHPLSGKVLHYKVKIHKIVTDPVEQISALVDVLTGLKKDEFSVKIDGEKAVISMKKDIREEQKKAVKEEIIKYVKGIKEVSFERI